MQISERRENHHSQIVHILLPTFWLLGRPDPWELRGKLESLLECSAIFVRIMREIMEVPFPLAASKRLISFFTFQISMFFSASFAWASLILADIDASSITAT